MQAKFIQYFVASDLDYHEVCDAPGVGHASPGPEAENFEDHTVTGIYAFRFDRGENMLVCVPATAPSPPAIVRVTCQVGICSGLVARSSHCTGQKPEIHWVLGLQ
jgi:hypothetical protein